MSILFLLVRCFSSYDDMSLRRRVTCPLVRSKSFHLSSTEGKSILNTIHKSLIKLYLSISLSIVFSSLPLSLKQKSHQDAKQVIAHCKDHLTAAVLPFQASCARKLQLLAHNCPHPRTTQSVLTLFHLSLNLSLSNASFHTCCMTLSFVLPVH